MEGLICQAYLDSITCECEQGERSHKSCARGSQAQQVGSVVGLGQRTDSAVSSFWSLGKKRQRPYIQSVDVYRSEGKP